MSNTHSKHRRPVIARLVRILSIPIILFWLAVAVALGIVTPSLDAVADQHSVSLLRTPLWIPRLVMPVGFLLLSYSTFKTIIADVVSPAA